MKIKAFEDLTWARCSCGVIFQEEIKDRKLSETYLEQYKQKKFYESSAQYPVGVYFPMIEEMIFGRRMLEVDSLDFEVSKAAAERGWITFATTSKDSSLSGEGIDVWEGGFDGIKEVPETKFDLIFAYHVIEKKESGDILKKFHDWLVPGGLLFLATPDTQYVDELGVPQFNHWFSENNILFSNPMLRRELEKAMFDVVLMRPNPSTRFLKNNDMHVIAQRGM